MVSPTTIDQVNNTNSRKAEQPRGVVQKITPGRRTNKFDQNVETPNPSLLTLR